MVSPLDVVREPGVRHAGHHGTERLAAHMHQRLVIAGFEVHVRLIEQCIVDDGRDMIGGPDSRDRAGIAPGSQSAKSSVTSRSIARPTWRRSRR